MYSSYKIQVSPEHELFAYCDDACFKAKNLYNATNYYVRQVHTALRSEKKHANQQDVLREIEGHLDAMNAVRRKSFEKEKTKPPKRDKKGEIIPPKLKLFKMPTAESPYVHFEFLDALFKAMKQPDYAVMPSQANQQTMKKVFDDWKSFFRSIREYRKNPSKFLRKPKMPTYKRKDGRTVCFLTNQIASIQENGCLKLPGTDLQLPLGKVALSAGKLQQVRIVPEYGRYVIEVVFKSKASPKAIVRKEEQKNIFMFLPKRVMGIDLGVDNLATIVDNTGLKPLLIKGTWLKSVNQCFNKLRANYVCILRNGLKPNEGAFASNRLIALDRKRNDRVMDFLHKASAEVVKIALERSIDTIVIGKNVGWKQSPEMAKASKQNFINIPHAAFITMIRYKAERIGIQVVDREESYTSKASFLSGDAIPTYGEAHETSFSGYRETRAFYKLKGSKVRIHADVNGALNIVRKHVPNAFDAIEKEAFLQAPKKIVLVRQKRKKAKLKTSV